MLRFWVASGPMFSRAYGATSQNWEVVSDQPNPQTRSAHHLISTETAYWASCLGGRTLWIKRQLVMNKVEILLNFRYPTRLIESNCWNFWSAVSRFLVFHAISAFVPHRFQRIPKALYLPICQIVLFLLSCQNISSKKLGTSILEHITVS